MRTNVFVQAAQPPKVGEILDWEGHSPAALKNLREHVERAKRLGIEAIND